MARLRRLTYPVPCGYCFQEWATGYDHLIPYSAPGGLAVDNNLYPCCLRCNGLLGSKVFGSIEEKREYVRDALIARGEWRLPDVQDEVQEEAPAPEVRLVEMPEAVLGSPASESVASRARVKPTAIPVERPSRPVIKIERLTFLKPERIPCERRSALHRDVRKKCRESLRLTLTGNGMPDAAVSLILHGFDMALDVRGLIDKSCPPVKWAYTYERIGSELRLVKGRHEVE